MLITITDPSGVNHFGYSEDAREYIEGLWNDMLVQKLADDDESIVMLQENDDEIEDGYWEIDFHSESELSDEANIVIDKLLKAANGKDESEKIMDIVNAKVDIDLDRDYNEA